VDAILVPEQEALDDGTALFFAGVHSSRILLRREQVCEAHVGDPLVVHKKPARNAAMHYEQRQTRPLEGLLCIVTQPVVKNRTDRFLTARFAWLRERMVPVPVQFPRLAQIPRIGVVQYVADHARHAVHRALN
jgi:hypothetical protein